MYKRLEELIKDTKGNVLTVCIDSKLIDEFYKNKNINLYSLTSDNDRNKIFGLIDKKKKNNPKYMKNNKGKNINIKKLKKEINKKSVDYMFCNMDEMLRYYKYFIRNLHNHLFFFPPSTTIVLDPGSANSFIETHISK